jgi:hypothetical protein
MIRYREYLYLIHLFGWLKRETRGGLQSPPLEEICCKKKEIKCIKVL